MKILSKANVQTPITNYSREVELLLCCSRTSIDNATCEQLTSRKLRIKTLVKKNIDWEYLLIPASQH
ncbi:hypothetical protein [Calothrix sp. PCC 6303]|uniref:hypothetical protein n=1 Tax=Calothrix sp. PCC 6303 TaxID=1170562 RepID=UPI0002EECB9E